MNNNASLNAAIWMAALYGVSAGICLLAGYLAKLSAHESGPTWGLWPWFAGLMLLLSLNASLQLDVSLVQWVRDVAKVGDWYAMRRPLQIATLLILAICIFMVSLRVSESPNMNHAAVLGIALLLAFAALRMVNLHYTDQILDWRWAGLRLGRIGELVGLVSVAVGGVQHISDGP